MQRYISKIKYLVGQWIDPKTIVPLQPYNETVVDFLDELSKKLVKEREYPDVVAVGFWCRSSHIHALKNARMKQCRVGRGMIFHIAPSNVPVNFAFSLFFGLLSGNANVVRVSSKDFPQVSIIAKALNECLDDKKYNGLKPYIQVVQYDRNEEITEFFSKECQGRIIWGGDHTIHEIWKAPLPVRAVEISFADRFSFAIFDSAYCEKFTEKQWSQLAHNFYNDTYLMDQNACSSPHLLVWKEGAKCLNKVQEHFYNALSEEAKKYELQDSKVSDKYTQLCENVLQLPVACHVERFTNLLYVTTLEELPDRMTELRGSFGNFFCYHLKDYTELNACMNDKVQTCLYVGDIKEDITKWILENGIRGVDRIVPVGQSLDMDVIWDGHDIIGELSRIIG